MSLLIETRNLTKRFGGLAAVNNVDFMIEKGRINAIIGPNGAGKSTFFNLISGFHRPTSGTVLFKGIDITKLPANEIAGLGISRTFQTTSLLINRPSWIMSLSGIDCVPNPIWLMPF